MNFMKIWYLIKTKPRQEQIAITNLERQNYKVYCPNTIINKKLVVLFPGYLFIHLDSEKQNWGPIRSTRGIKNFVRFGLKYAWIHDSIIGFIKANELYTKEKIENLNEYKIGEKVEITDGIFKNYISIVRSIEPEERVVLLLNLLGQQQSINLKKKSIIRI